MLTEPSHPCFGSSFQFETETDGGKLRRNVLAEGRVSSTGAPSSITSILSGQEELFAFHRAVSSDSSLLLVANCDIIIIYHCSEMVLCSISCS